LAPIERARSAAVRKRGVDAVIAAPAARPEEALRKWRRATAGVLGFVSMVGGMRIRGR